MARQEHTSYEPNVPSTGNFMEDWTAQDRAIAEESGEALKRYDETGSIKGLFYHAPYADSYAVYRVTKERPLTVQHVATGDAWRLPTAHIRGLNAADIKAEADRRLAWRNLGR